MKGRFVGLHFLLSVAISSLLVAASSAMPIEYHIFAEPGNHPSKPSSFDGARFEIVFQFDTAGLQPQANLNPNETEWPTSNTVSHLIISGTAALDGVYNATTFEVGGWELSYSSNRSTLIFPNTIYDLGQFPLRVNASLNLSQSFFGNSSFPIQPRPFGPSDNPSWQTLGFMGGVSTNSFEFIGANRSGYAIAVPEPATLATASFALLTLAALRRRK